MKVSESTKRKDSLPQCRQQDADLPSQKQNEHLPADQEILNIVQKAFPMPNTPSALTTTILSKIREKAQTS